MAWLELHQSVVNHRKTLAFADALDIDPVHALGHMASVWLWALDNAPDGMLKTITDKTLARAAQWRGDASAFRAALVSAELVNKAGALHDWDDYAGKLIDRRRQNAARMRDARGARAEDVQDTSSTTETERATNVQRTSTARAPATVQNSTVPNRTKEEGIPEPLLKAQDVLVPFVTRGFIPDRDNLLKVGQTYPNLDLDLEFRKLADWLRADKNRKEQCSWRRIFNWLKRAEEYRHTNAHKNGTVEYPPPVSTNGALADAAAFAEARKILARL